MRNAIDFNQSLECTEVINEIICFTIYILGRRSSFQDDQSGKDNNDNNNKRGVC